MFNILLFTFFTILLTFWYISTRRPNNFPPGPKWLPFVGNASELRKAIKIHGTQTQVFEMWKKKFKSPIIGLKLGNEMVAVALSYTAVQEVCKSDVFLSRPDYFFIRLRENSPRLGVTYTDGDFWIEQRHFVLRHLRRAGFGRPPMEEHMQEELNELTEIIDKHDGKPVWIGEFLPISVFNVLWKFTAGTKISRSDDRLMRLIELMRKRNKAFDAAGGWLSTMPFLRFIAPEKVSYNLIRKLNAEQLSFFKPIIEEHKNTFTADKIDEDLIYSFINEMRSSDYKSNFTDIQLTMIIMDLFVGGSHTTSTTLDFALMSMVLYPNIQAKCHKNIDDVLGKEQYPKLKDKSKLTYVEAVILETQRFYNVLPISPRRAVTSTQLAGYDIPKDTTVLIGLESVNMDKDHWIDPAVFRPERFLDKNNKIINTERLVPFGKGKKGCLGEPLALACLFTYLVGILQNYRLELPEDTELPEQTPIPGLLYNAKPYQVLFKRRM